MRGHTTQKDMDALDMNIEKYYYKMTEEDMVKWLTVRYNYHRDTVRKHYRMVGAKVQEQSKADSKLKRINELISGVQ